MIDLEIDENGNVVLENSDLAFVSDDDEIAQSVRIRLRTWFGEWYLDKDYGTDYLGKILVRPFSQTRARKEIERVILGTVGVKRVARFTQDIDTTRHTFSYSAEVVTATNSRLFIGDTVGIQ